MIQRRERLGLTLEPRETVGVVRKRFGQHFDRDLAIEARILRAIDLTHPAGADGGQNLVRSDPRTDLEWQEEAAGL
jgi:hypothetical protein